MAKARKSHRQWVAILLSQKGRNTKLAREARGKLRGTRKRD